ncbi:MAG: AMP-binding protein [Actinomycetes bacterium]|jgi:amino acid adenylation domain-containing protein|nr:AMP-binding protein [Actinomycetes bacterium]
MNTVAMLLVETARNHPHAVGYEDQFNSISFSCAHNTAVQLALTIRANDSEANRCVHENGNLNPGKPILVYLPKGSTCIPAFFGCIYSCNPYVPVDYTQPMERIRRMRDISGARYVITDSAGCKRLRAEFGDSLTCIDIDSISAELVTSDDLSVVLEGLNKVCDTDPAIIMFTSGSTGDPKGVTLSHRSVIDYANWIVDTFNFGTDTVLGGQAAFHFVSSVFDIFSVTLSGGKLITMPDKIFRFPQTIPQYLIDNKVTGFLWGPAIMKSIVKIGALDNTELPDLKNCFFGGELTSNATLNVWRRAVPQAQFINLYGMTETTSALLHYIVDRPYDDNEAIPAGVPCKNMRAFIVNPDGTLASPGEVGEVCACGTGLASGYWNNPDLTSRVFVQNPFNRAYREIMLHTGDIGVMDTDGLITVKGRNDSQIQYRGNRIELGEIDMAIAGIDEIVTGCVLYDQVNEELVLFAVFQEDVQTGNMGSLLKDINTQLKETLPAYMMLHRIQVLEEMPLTPSGKAHRLKLREMFLSE